MSSYLAHKDTTLRALAKLDQNTWMSRADLQKLLGTNDTDLESLIILLVRAGFMQTTKSDVHVTPEGREFISYTSFQNEYDKSYAKELYETAKQSDYETTRLIAVWAIRIAGATLLLEVLKAIFPSLRS